MKVYDVPQNTPEWDRLRAGVPTASEFSRVVTTKGEISKSLDDYALQLAAERYAGKYLDRFEGNWATKRGHEMEQRARDWYAFQFDYDVEQVGFVTDDNARYGASPDGLVRSDGMVQFKCLTAKEHLKVLLSGGSKITPYFTQVQGEMMVCNRRWNDLVFFHPDLPCFVSRQYRDMAFEDSLLVALAELLLKRDSALLKMYSL